MELNWQKIKEQTKIMFKERRLFHQGLLTTSEIFRIEKDVKCEFDKSPQHSISSYGETYYNGVAVGFLDTASKIQTKGFEAGKKFKADLLILKPGTHIFSSYFNGGFYHYNPHRVQDDRVFSFKIKQ